MGILKQFVSPEKYKEDKDKYGYLRIYYNQVPKLY